MYVHVNKFVFTVRSTKAHAVEALAHTCVQKDLVLQWLSASCFTSMNKSLSTGKVVLPKLNESRG